MGETAPTCTPLSTKLSLQYQEWFITIQVVGQTDPMESHLCGQFMSMEGILYATKAEKQTSIQ